MLQFHCDNAPLQAKFDAALAGLRGNCREFYSFTRQPVLIEGGVYPGVWLECSPLEGLVYSAENPAVGLANHRIFFELQREDGYFPALIRSAPVGMEIGTGMIQMVVPIAATALEMARQTGDESFLTQAYSACVRWDGWLERHRDRRGLGLCEAFCEFDTGHDNSPRWRGLPHSCPDNDARRCPAAGTLPFLAPDLSATLFGGRMALAQMARRLGRESESEAWQAKAQRTRAAILAHCFDEADLCFYDRDARGDLLRIRGDALLRVLSEHVVDQRLFDAIFARHIKNPQAFWTPFPLPSIAADDPAFVHHPSENAWSGPSQALTALRAPRWFEHYGKFADLIHLMQRWMLAIIRSGGFMQQMDPWTGQFNTSDGYTPAMLAMIDFTARCHGVRRSGDELHWTALLPDGATRSAFSLQTPSGIAELQLSGERATALLGGRSVFTVEGGKCRVVTDLLGRLMRLVGVDAAEHQVTIRAIGVPGTLVKPLWIKSDEQIQLSAS